MPQRKNEVTMNTNQDTEAIDEIREEYDFANMKDGVRGKYSEAFGKTKVAVLLDEDVSMVFPDSRSVNEALRTLARVIKEQK